MPSFPNAAWLQETNDCFAEHKHTLTDRLKWASTTYGDDLVIVTSFGPSSMVILDHILQFNPDVQIITIDTTYLFPETYDLIKQVQDLYPSINLQIRQSRISPQQQDAEYGPHLWERDPDTCCFVRKVVPLVDALAGKAAWISGIRRDQSKSRQQSPFVQWDTRNELIKIAPLADWSESDVWDYIHAHELPYNALHDRGYTSIGCTHCTRAVKPGEDLRAGRWAGLDKVECGIHINDSTLRQMQ